MAKSSVIADLTSDLIWRSGEFKVSEYPDNPDGGRVPSGGAVPSITALTDGGFVISWTGYYIFGMFLGGVIAIIL